MADALEGLVQRMLEAGESDDAIRAVVAQAQPLNRPTPPDDGLGFINVRQSLKNHPLSLGPVGDWLTLGMLVAGGPAIRGGAKLAAGALRTLNGTRLGGALATGLGEAASKVPMVGPGLRAGVRAYQASRPVASAPVPTLSQAMRTPVSSTVRRLVLDPAEAAREAHVDQLAKQLASRTGTLNASGAREALLRMLAGGE